MFYMRCQDDNPGSGPVTAGTVIAAEAVPRKTVARQAGRAAFSAAFLSLFPSAFRNNGSTGVNPRIRTHRLLLGRSQSQPGSGSPANIYGPARSVALFFFYLFGVFMVVLWRKGSVVFWLGPWVSLMGIVR